MKRLIFGLLVAGIAFGSSAFTNVKHFKPVKGNKSITADFLAQTSSGTYTQQSSGGNCSTLTSLACHYDVVIPNGIPDRGESGTYTSEEITSYKNSGWLVAQSSNGVYTPL